MHSCKIKFGAINNLSDARYAAAVNAVWLGFSFDMGNPRHILPARAKEIIDWVSGPEMVVEITDQEPETLKEALGLLGIGTVQCHAGKAEIWRNAGFEVIVACSISQLTPALHQHTVLISDYTSNIDISSFPPKHIIDITELSLETIRELKKQNVYAINLNGGDESGPGLRDFAEVDEILEVFASEE